MARFRRSKLFRRFSSRESTSSEKHDRPSPPPLSTSASAGAAASVRSGSPSLNTQLYPTPPQWPLKSSSVPRLRTNFTSVDGELPEVPCVSSQEQTGTLEVPADENPTREEDEHTRRSGSETLAGARSEEFAAESDEEKEPDVSATELKLPIVESLRRQPVVVVEQPTPDLVEEVKEISAGRDHSPHSIPKESPTDLLSPESAEQQATSHSTPSTSRTPSPTPSLPEYHSRRHSNTIIRRPSIVDSANATIVKTLLDAPIKREDSVTSASITLPTTVSTDDFTQGLHHMTAMLHRKIWVKRPGGSATLVQIREDDLVDDVRDMILRKYANSLGRTFDAPDMTLSITTRAEHGEQRNERVLGPEEEMCRTIDSYYPGGQTVHEALTINVPQQRQTPRPSPRAFQNSNYHAMDEYRPLENGTEYFPPMPAVIPTTLPQTSGSDHSRTSAHHHPAVSLPPEHPRSISVLNTGQIPPLPSPGGNSRRHQHRPKYNRQPTSSPVILSHPNGGAVAVNPPPAPQQLVHRQSIRPRLDSVASEAQHRDMPNGTIPPAPPLPTPPAPEAAPTNKNNSQPPTPSGTVHRLQKPRRSRKESMKTSSRARGHPGGSPTGSSQMNGMLDNTVPPINVLIVEDNIINLRILEGLMKRLKVRWQTAMNGQIAVDKWKAGGFHLVLMDIQMPVLNGLQATKEIRRLERVNGIGVFSELASPDEAEEDEGHENGAHKDTPGKPKAKGKEKESDKLLTSEGLFKSPVIIVALTASSLQSDRHEALAAGCNDFLTKPVNFVWLERKVKEWGCMQALIDFDGWKKWKDFAARAEEDKSEEQKQKEREKEERERVKAEKMAKLQEKQAKLKEEKERKKRQSLSLSEVGGEGAANGGVVSPSATGPSLRPAAEMIGETNFALAG